MIIVESFQMTQKRRFNNEDWPLWLHEAWNRRKGDNNSLYPTPNKDTLNLSPYSPYLPFPVELEVLYNYWIVKDANGNLHVLSTESLEQTLISANLK